LAERARGFDLLEQVFDRAAVLLAFEQTGGADRCLEMAKEYALEA
jgi:alkylation response protein AidB-like acyl-CoA dehydrogenase